MEKSLKISVIIVTFNRALDLKDALHSLTLQVRMPDEVIVVDNNSTDNTSDIAGLYKQSLNLKYILEKRQGIPIARNTGVKNASGDLIVFTDDDCVVDKEWLRYLEFPFLRDPDIGMAGGKIFGYQTTNNLIEEYCIYDHLMRVSFD